MNTFSSLVHKSKGARQRRKLGGLNPPTAQAVIAEGQVQARESGTEGSDAANRSLFLDKVCRALRCVRVKVEKTLEGCEEQFSE